MRRRAILGAAVALTLAAAARAADLPALPEPASSLGAVASGGYLYTYGGNTGGAHAFSTATVSGKFRRVKLTGGAWEELPGGPILQGLNIVAHAGKVYRVGGMSPRNDAGKKADLHSTAECARFDPAAGKWEPVAGLPEPRSSHDVVVAGDKIIAVGGWALAGAGDGKWHDTAAVLDLSAAKPQWKAVAQPFKRRALAAAAHAGKVYVFGGMDEAGSLTREVAVFDPTAGVWAKGPEFPGGDMNGFSPAAVSDGGKLYLSVADGAVFVLNPAGDKWDKVAALERPRFVHRLVPDGQARVLAVGGASRQGNVGLIEAVGAAKGDTR